jgi:hypothetical protein
MKNSENKKTKHQVIAQPEKQLENKNVSDMGIGFRVVRMKAAQM